MSSKFAVTVSTAAGVVGFSYILWSIYQRMQRKRLPTSWRQVGTLNDLLAYPIKSCQWVELQEAECTHMGLRAGWLRDRTLMVIDQKANFISARAYPEMLRVKPSFEGSRMTLTHPGMEPVVMDLEEARKAPKFKACVWGTPVDVHSCGWEPSEWFSRLLKKEADSLRLVYYAPENCRPLRANTNPIFPFQKNDTGALPDETSFNLINEASVEDLNRRVDGSTVTCWPRQFRPNFVLKGAMPYDEDNWQYVKIGNNVFETIKPCTRCIMTTIDPETAIKDASGEPLETLKSYRQVSDPAFRKSAGSSPKMGLQLALRSPPGASVKLGDPIYVPCSPFTECL